MDANDPQMTAHVIKAWHAAGKDDVLVSFSTTQDGLSEIESRKRLVENGPNLLPPPPRRSALRRLAEFQDLRVDIAELKQLLKTRVAVRG